MGLRCITACNHTQRLKGEQHLHEKNKISPMDNKNDYCGDSDGYAFFFLQDNLNMGTTAYSSKKDHGKYDDRCREKNSDHGIR